MAKRPVYRTFKTSKVFKTKAEASKWAKEEKKKMNMAGSKVRLEIDYVENRGGWKVRILVKSGG